MADYPANGDYEVSVGQDPRKVLWFGKVWLYTSGVPQLVYTSIGCYSEGDALGNAQTWVKSWTLQ